MFFFYRFRMFLLAFAFLAAATQAKPFHRVLVLTGGSLDFFIRLGIWDAVRESGWEPDIVITTCGTSLLGAVIQAEPDPRAAKEFMFSREFHERLRESATMDKRSGLRALTRVYFKDDRKHVPHVFGRTIIDVARESPHEKFSRGFNPRNPRVLMVAAKLSFGPEAEGKKWSEVDPIPVQEVFLTDEDTAMRLPAFTSPVAALSNRISPLISVETHWDLWNAARASYAEPYLLAPFQVGEHYYATGALDLVPVELGMALGDDVLVTYTGQMDGSHSRGFENMFGFSQNERGAAARSIAAKGLRWIDLSDDGAFYDDYGISPDLPFLNQWLPIPGIFMRIRERMPKNYEEYLYKVQNQYAYGVERGREALTRALDGSPTPIRKPWKH